ncbi:glycosyl hydrolase [Bacteroidia bacterium]|nr:glycosyl hydrolase [Bacteroidia bacterium]
MKILIIRFSSIGDIVVTTPIVRCLKQQLKCELHYLTKPVNKQLLEANPYIDKIHTLDNDGNIPFAVLRNEQFDYIVDLHRNLRSLRVKLALRKPFVVYRKLNLQKLLLVLFKLHCLPKKHLVDRYFDCVHRLGVHNDDHGLDYFINDSDRITTELPNSFLEQGFIAIAVGSQHITKQLPEDKLIAIGRQLPYNIVLLGDRNDQTKALSIEKALGSKVFNACGKFSMNQSVSVVQQSKVLLSGDTGLMHIAAALKHPIVAVFSNTVRDFGMYPYLPSSMQDRYTLVEVESLTCRPCSKMGFKQCPKKHFHCMKDIDNQTIIDALEHFCKKSTPFL